MNRHPKPLITQLACYALLLAMASPMSVTATELAKQPSGQPGAASRTPHHATSAPRALTGADALLQAAAQGDAVSLRRLLAEGVPPGAADPQRGFTALHNAAAMGHVTLVEALLAAGAEVDTEDRNGVTALISAAYHGHVPVLARLLEHGADPNHQPHAAPMALAAALYANSRPALDTLLAAGADPEQRDFAGISAHDVALRAQRTAMHARLLASTGMHHE